MTDSVSSGAGGKGIPYHLPTAEMTLEITAGFTIDGSQVVLSDLRGSVSQAKPVIDTSRQYVMRYEPNILGDDHLCVTLTDDGLLDTVQLVAADRTTDIVVNVAKAAIAVSTLYSGGPSAGAYNLASGQASQPTFQWASDPFLTLTFEPDASPKFLSDSIESAFGREVGRLVAQAQQTGTNFSVDAGLLSAYRDPNTNLVDVQLSGDAINGDAPFVDVEALSGFLVRPLGKAEINVVPYRGPTSSSVAYVPSRAATTNVDLKRSFGVAKHYAIKLKNGNVSTYEVNKSSEALAASKLPLDIVNAVLNVPVQVFQGLGRVFQSEADMVQAQSNADLQAALAERIQDGDEVKVVDHGNLTNGTEVTIAASDSAPSKFKSGLSCRVLEKPAA
ncbi:MAG: hypothetical protein Pyrs2KO_26600 [Pyruvatibacter sp.]